MVSFESVRWANLCGSKRRVGASRLLFAGASLGLLIPLDQVRAVAVAGEQVSDPCHLCADNIPDTALTPMLRPLLAQIQSANAAPSVVSLTRGESRRANVFEALTAIDQQIQPVLKTKKSVAIKVNNVSTVNQLAATHADSIHGILDYLAPRFQGPVYIVESAADDTLEGFDNFKYAQLVADRKPQEVELIDLNREAKFKVVAMLDYDLHAKSARMAARLFDPETYIFCASIDR